MKTTLVLALVAVVLLCSPVLSAPAPADDDIEDTNLGDINVNEELDKDPIPLEEQEIDEATLEKIRENLRHLDTLDIEQFLKRPRVIEAHMKCVLEEPNAPCDAVGKRLKAVIPYMLRDQCESCTSPQRGKIIKVAKNLKNEHPEYYKKLIEKFAAGEEPPELEAL